MDNHTKSILLILSSSLLAGVGQLLWKKASMELTPSIKTLINPYLIIGIVIYLLATTLMILAFRKGELSVLHPFLATSFIWVVLISPVFFSNETLSTSKILGSILVFFGVSLIGIGGKNEH